MKRLLLLCLLSSTAWAAESVSETCGDDRRCRLELFEIRQQQRRIARERERREVEQVEADRIESLRRALMPVRAARRWGVDLMVNPNTALGAVSGLAGVQLTPHLRVEAMVGWVDMSEGIDNGYVSAEGLLAGVRLRWFFLLGNTSPYVALGGFGHSTTVNRNTWNEPTIEPGVEDERIEPGDDTWEDPYSYFGEEKGEAHVGVLSLGVEHVFPIGLRVAAEVQVFKAWYVQVVDGQTGVPSEQGRSQLQEGYDALFVGGGFAAGWSF